MKLPPQNNFESAPTGNHIACCFRLIDLGTMEGIYGKRREVVVGWELSETKMEDGRPFIINKWYTYSMNEKANLRIDLESWRGRPFTTEEFESFDMKNILSTSCLVSVLDKDGKTRAGVVSALPQGTPKQSLKSNDVQHFSFDEPDHVILDKLPDWLVDRIKQSDEYAAWQGEAIQQESEVPPDDEIPF